MAPGLIVQQNPKRASESPQGYAQRIALLAERATRAEIFEVLQTAILNECKNAKGDYADACSNMLILLTQEKKKLLK